MKGGETGQERIQIRRLRGTLTLLEAEMGKRVGLLVARSQRAVDAVDVRTNRVSQRPRDRGRRRGLGGKRSALCLAPTERHVGDLPGRSRG